MRYAPGDAVATLEIVDRTGHVHEAHVTGVYGPIVETDRGRFEVDEFGQGTEVLAVGEDRMARELFPMDEETAICLASRGDGYELAPTTLDLGHHIGRDRGFER